MINFSVVEADILKKRRDSKAYYDKSAGIEQRPINIGSHAYAKPPPRHRGKPWIYGEVIKNDNIRSYTIRTPHGSMIRRNRVQLKPAATPPPHQPHTAVKPATEDTRINPTPLPDTTNQAQVNPQASQQIHCQISNREGLGTNMYLSGRARIKMAVL